MNQNKAPPEAPDAPQAEASNSKRLTPGRLIPIGILLLGLAAFYLFGLDQYLSLDALKQHRATLVGLVERHGLLAGLCFVSVYAVAVAFSLPGGALMTILGGFLFGPYVATCWVVVGATIGATALFLAARHALADYLRAKAGPALRKMEDGFNRDALSYILVLRLVPLFPFWLVNLVPALLGVRLGTYVFGTFFGIIPGTFVYSLVGDGVGAVLDQGGDIDFGIIFNARFLAPIVGLAVLALIPVVYKRLKARRNDGDSA